MIIKSVMETIEKHSLIQRGDYIVVAVSGGPDSICLLHLLHELASDLQLKLMTVHINHMLRGKESEEDEEDVRERCKILEIPLHIERIHIGEYAKQRKMSLEEAGREARYHVFKTVMQKYGANKIAVAHNRKDQAETVLMNIMRGTGALGLKGMDYIRGPLIRPLLDIDRKEIEQYCEDHCLNPRVDSSNLDNVYTRNKVRLDLIPYIDSLFNIDIVEKVNQLSVLIREDLDFMNEAAQKSFDQTLIKQEKEDVRLNIVALKNIHPALQKKVLRNGIACVKGNLKGIEYNHIEKITKLIENARTGAQLHLPGGVRVSLSYDTLRIFLETGCIRPDRFDHEIIIPGETSMIEINSRMKATVLEKKQICGKKDKPHFQSYSQIFDYDVMKKGIHIRNRREGDVFKPNKSNGTKKLKEYFIDKKIPREIRDTIPLVAIEGEIIWIIGYGISDHYKVTEETNRVLELSYEYSNSRK